MSRVSVKLSWGKSVHITAGPESITCFGFWQGVTIGIVNHLCALYSVHSVDLLYAPVLNISLHFLASLGGLPFVVIFRFQRKHRNRHFQGPSIRVLRIFSQKKFYKEWSYTQNHSPKVQVTKITCSLLSQTARYKTMFFTLEKSIFQLNFRNTSSPIIREGGTKGWQKLITEEGSHLFSLEITVWTTTTDNILIWLPALSDGDGGLARCNDLFNFMIIWSYVWQKMLRI